MNSLSVFPRELKFLRFIFGLGACTGLFLFIIGLLALFVGSALRFFSEDPGSLTWTLNFLAYGMLGTFVSIRVFLLLRHRDTSAPRLIVRWVGWLVLGEIVLRLVVYLNSGVFPGLIFDQLQSLALWSVFYVLVSSQFRWLTVVRDYYGALAPPSRLAWMNDVEKWMLRAMGLERDRGIS